MIFGLNQDGRQLRIDVLMDGRVVWVEGGSLTNIASLDGIHFVVPEEPLVLVEEPYVPMEIHDVAKTSGVARFSTFFQDLSAVRVGRYCILTGYARVPRINMTYFRTTEACRPAKRFAMSVHANSDSPIVVEVRYRMFA